MALLEANLLLKIKQIDSKYPVTTFEKITFEDNRPIKISTVEQAIAKIMASKKERAESEKKILQASSKIDYIKTQIRDITIENKDQLLSYQLQYALYQLVVNKESARKIFLDDFITLSTDELQRAITRLNTEPYEKMTKELNDLKVTINDLEEKKVALSTELEREMLLESNNTNKLTLQKEQTYEKLDESYRHVLKKVLHIALMDLVLGQKEAFSKSLKSASYYVDNIDLTKGDSEYEHYQLVKQFAKEHFGTASMAVMASKESASDSLIYLSDLLYKPLFVFNEKAVSSVDILKIFTIFLFGFFLASFYHRRLLNWSETWVKSTPMTAKLMANLGYYVIILMTFIIALNSIGLDLTSLSMFASALAIGIGFGFQTVVSNMVAGVIMMFERSVRIGDFVEISGGLKGTVTDIRIRSTVIKTFDNIDVVVPNSSFVQNNVVNMTLDDKTRRIHIPFGVAYGTKVEAVEHAILGELAQSELNYYKGQDKGKKPLVKMLAMGGSSVDYELLVWIEWGNKKKPSASASDFLILIYNTLYKYNIEIPFPQLDLRVKDSSQKTDISDKI